MSELTPEIQSKINWANENPDDPHAQVILSQAKQMFPESLQKTPLEAIGESGKILAKEVAPYAGGFVQGVAEGFNPLAIPRGLEVLGRTLAGTLKNAPIGSNYHEPTSLWDTLKKANQEAVTPIPSIGDIAATLRTIATTNPFHPSQYPKNFQEEQKVQKEYEKMLPQGAIETGEIASALPAAILTGRLAYRGVIKGLGMIPAFEGTVQNLTKEAMIGRGLSETAADAAIKNAGDLEDLKKVGDKYLYEKAQDLTQAVSQYKDFRNETYNKMMNPLIAEYGKDPVPVEEVKKVIFDARGESENLSGKLNKYLDGIQEELKDKNTITFKRANEIKQDLSNKFGAFKGNQYIGQTKYDAIAARQITGSLKDTINASVIDSQGNSLVQPINDAYHEASELIDGLNRKVIGPKTAGRYFQTQQKLAGSMNNQEVQNLLDDFTKVYPEAEDTVDGFRAFLAAKELKNGITPRATIYASHGKLGSRMVEGIKELAGSMELRPMEQGLTANEAMQSPLLRSVSTGFPLRMATETLPEASAFVPPAALSGKKVKISDRSARGLSSITGGP